MNENTNQSSNDEKQSPSKSSPLKTDEMSPQIDNLALNKKAKSDVNDKKKASYTYWVNNDPNFFKDVKTDFKPQKIEQPVEVE